MLSVFFSSVGIFVFFNFNFCFCCCLCFCFFECEPSDRATFYQLAGRQIEILCRHYKQIHEGLYMCMYRSISYNTVYSIQQFKYPHTHTYYTPWISLVLALSLCVVVATQLHMFLLLIGYVDRPVYLWTVIRHGLCAIQRQTHISIYLISNGQLINFTHWHRYNKYKCRDINSPMTNFQHVLLIVVRNLFNSS